MVRSALRVKNPIQNLASKLNTAVPMGSKDAAPMLISFETVVAEDRKRFVIALGRTARCLANDDDGNTIAPKDNKADIPGQIARHAVASFGMVLRDQLSGGIFRRCDEVSQAAGMATFIYDRANPWGVNDLGYFAKLNLHSTSFAFVIHIVQSLPGASAGGFFISELASYAHFIATSGRQEGAVAIGADKRPP